MTPLLADESQRREAELEARGTIGATVRKATTALGLLFLVSQPSPSLAALPERRFLGTRTLGTGAEILCLKISEADLFFQINRIYDELHRGQVDLDADSRQTLYENLWSLYS